MVINQTDPKTRDDQHKHHSLSLSLSQNQSYYCPADPANQKQELSERATRSRVVIIRLRSLLRLSKCIRLIYSLLHFVYVSPAIIIVESHLN